MRPCFCCNNFSNKKVLKLNLEIVNDIPLSNKLVINYCDNCNFYYSNSTSVQKDYDLYYEIYNNYSNYNYCLDKDKRCFDFLKEIVKKYNIKNIIDYGSGNGDLHKLLSEEYDIVDKYDIGMEKNIKKYDLLILSHVLEHIYDLDKFTDIILTNIKDDGYLYIEVPNAEFYNEFNDSCPLQEINLEHINFFSKFALNKLLLNKGFICTELLDDYFILNKNKYHIIRGVFKLKSKNNNFLNYLNTGNSIIEEYKYEKLSKYPNIYVYGCGQFLFKLFNNIKKYTNIINIVDDNICYNDKKIDTVSIINYNNLKNIINQNNVVLITSLIHYSILEKKILDLNKDIIIINI